MATAVVSVLVVGIAPQETATHHFVLVVLVVVLVVLVVVLVVLVVVLVVLVVVLVVLVVTPIHC